MCIRDRVQWSRQVVSDGRADAVILNSGGANACTGSRGFVDTHHTAEKVAAVLGVGAGDVVVCSTGLIGERLPMQQLLPGVDAAAAALSADGLPAAARAIMTTDSVPKLAAADGTGWSVAGIAKGAGMLAPALATMLVVLTTDAAVSAPVLDDALRRATALTFDRIDSDAVSYTHLDVYKRQGVLGSPSPTGRPSGMPVSSTPPSSSDSACRPGAAPPSSTSTS